ncbi:hypothetical protein HYE13_03750 [Mycoplasmopsis bovis]|nr:hypothetical protein [Mycoplasmopsis bovis]QQH26118.1 hypothetical protein HYE13_03750 [Mycoplasmopsis bovis]
MELKIFLFFSILYSLTKQKAPQVNLRRFLLPFVKIWVSKLKKRKAFTLYMISNDKNTSYSTDLCLLKKKLNVHGKYKFNYVHYVCCFVLPCFLYIM